MRLFVNNLLRQKTRLFYFLSMGIAWSFALFMWFGGSLKQRHFAHFRKKKRKISKLQRLKIGLGMSNIELK